MSKLHSTLPHRLRRTHRTARKPDTPSCGRATTLGATLPSWDELRRQTRQAVHATVAFPAIYTPPGGGVPVEVNARLHPRAGRFGGLAREGLAPPIEGVHRRGI